MLVFVLSPFLYLLSKNVPSLESLETDSAVKKKKKERIKGEEKNEKRFNGAFDLVSPQNYSFARTFKLAVVSPDYIQHDIQENLKASQKISRIKMDFHGNDVNITRVATE